LDPVDVLPDWMRQAWGKADSTDNYKRKQDTKDIVKLALLYQYGGTIKETEMISVKEVKHLVNVLGTAGSGN